MTNRHSIPRKNVVLVVDDSLDMLSMLNEVLDQAGMKVLVALDGEQALQIAEGITPDIVLLDAMMPGMDGFETCQRLKQIQEFTHVPVIFMTGLSDSASIVRGLEAGGVDYVTKPIKQDELLARIQVHLANTRLTLSARRALDSAGQYLFAVDERGYLVWATPQAQSLLQDAGFDENWLDDMLPRLFQAVSALPASQERSLLLEGGSRPLEMRYLGKIEGDEYLLRLNDTVCMSEQEILKQVLDLTGREAEVLLWIAKGKTNPEIGIILSMSPRTVNKHLEHIFKKLDVDNRTSAAVTALSCLREAVQQA